MKKLAHYFYKTIDVVTDILIIPIIILCAVCTVSLFSARNNGEVPYLLGVAATRVLSESMMPEFEVGDTVLLQQVPISEIAVGDYIGFYDSPSVELYFEIIYTIAKLTGEPVDGANSLIWQNGLTHLNTYKDADKYPDVYRVMENHDFKVYQGYLAGNEVEKETASSALTGSNKEALKSASSNPNSRTFHKVIAIYQDTVTGKLYFHTNGINTAVDHDDYYIPEDFIIGKYNKQNTLLSVAGEVIGFCGSLQGIIWLVEVPCGIMLLMLAIQLIQQIDEYMQDKSRRKRALENPMLKNRARAVEGRRIITKKITHRFKIWFNKFLYFGAGDEKGMEVRKVRNAKLTLRKSMQTNFTTSANSAQTTTTQQASPNSNVQTTTTVTEKTTVKDGSKTTTTTTKSVTKSTGTEE